MTSHFNMTSHTHSHTTDTAHLTKWALTQTFRYWYSLAAEESTKRLDDVDTTNTVELVAEPINERVRHHHERSEPDGEVF